MPIMKSKCSHLRTSVEDSRKHSNSQKRKRKCSDCGKVWWTLEVPLEDYALLQRVKAISSHPKLVEKFICY